MTTTEDNTPNPYIQKLLNEVIETILWEKQVDLRDEVAMRILPSFTHFSPYNAAAAAYEYAEAFLDERLKLIQEDIEASIPD